MTSKELLDKFAEYIRYDREQKSFFRLGSFDYEFHLAGKNIEELLKEYDPSGVIACMYAREIFLQATKAANINLYNYLTKSEIREDVKKDMDMYQMFYDLDILTAEDYYIQNMNRLVQQTVGVKLIGDVDPEQDRASFIASAIKVVEDLKKCRLDVFQAGGAIGNIEKFTTRILLFEKMVYCLLYLEKAPDALYFCYISNGQTADGYFAFIFKSNGSMISINDRIPEKFIGQHTQSRNGQWAEEHAYKLFPYNYIFQYGKYDYKGYATEYVIEDTKLDFKNLNIEVYLPILIAMILLREKYADYVPKKDDIKYLNSMIPEYYLEEHPGTDLLALEQSAIAIRHQVYSPELDIKKILSGEYNKKWQLHGAGQFWVDLYGEGFVPDYDQILTSAIPKKLLTDKNHPYYAEFVGTKDDFDLNVYRNVRIQLAKYIAKKMEQEYDAFGGKTAIEDYWFNLVKDKKNQIIDAACESAYYAYYKDKIPKIKPDNVQNDIFKIRKDAYPDWRSINFFNSKPYIKRKACLNIICDTSKSMIEEIYDDCNRAKCTIFVKMHFSNFVEMENFIGMKLPKIFQGYMYTGKLAYSGNSILDVTDAVAELTSPCYRNCDFDVWIGFSKNTWKKFYEKWLVDNGKQHALDDMKAKKAEERRIRKSEKERPKEPYQPSGNFAQFSNRDRLEEIARETYDICGIIIGGAYSSDTSYEKDENGITKEYKRITHMYMTVPVRGNKEVISALKTIGWRKYAASRSKDGNMIHMSFLC